MYLQGGLQRSVFANGYPGVRGTAAAASPQGPDTITEQAYGVVAGDTGGSNTPFYAVIGGGGLALGALLFIWWSLPR
jgi:LPXTG-motif cell wall-anchored protein